MEPEDTDSVHKEINWQIPAILFTIVFVISVSQIVYQIVPEDVLTTPGITSVSINFAMLHGVCLLTILSTIFILVPRELWWQTLKLDQHPNRSILFKALGTTAIIIPIVQVIFGITVYFMVKYGIELTENPIVNWMKTAPANVMCLIIFGAVVIAPAAEEIMFRLVIYECLLKIGNSTLACYLTCLIFAVFHMIPEQILPLFILAVVLQKSLQKSKCLWTAILIHAFFNSFAVILTLLYRYHMT